MAEEELQYDTPNELKLRELPHALTMNFYKKSSAPYEAEAINLGADLYDHIRDHRFFKLHPLITFFGFFSKNFGGSLLLRTAFFMFFLIFQSLQQCISFK